MIRVTKNVKESNAITHAGTFHADDVLATVILSKYLKNITVFRAKEMPSKIPKRTIVYDIGLGEFDHHQMYGNGKRPNGVPYAASGLVWKQFGRKIIVKMGCKREQHIESVFKKIDKELIQGVDALDNGEFIKTDYPVKPMSITQMVAKFNPTWDCDEDEDEAFLEAVRFTEIIFDKLFKDVLAKVKARDVIEENIKKTDGHIMVLDKNMPWQEAITGSLNPKAKEIWFVVYPGKREGFRWKCVYDITNEKLPPRKEVPSEWRGLGSIRLQRLTGVKTAIFCHPAGFIGGAKTLEDTILMLEKALE